MPTGKVVSDSFIKFGGNSHVGSRSITAYSSCKWGEKKRWKIAAERGEARKQLGLINSWNGQ